MAQHDYDIANQSGAAFRQDLNNALAAIVSNNSGAAEPSTTYAYQFWADTTAGLLKIRNAANNAWITLRELDGTLAIEAGTAAAPGLYFAGDVNTGLMSPGADRVGITTGGTQRVEVDASGRVLVGTSSTSGNNSLLQVRNDSAAIALELQRSSDNAGAPGLYLTKSRGTQGSPAEVINGDQIGVIAFSGYDGALYRDCAYIAAEADGGWTDSGDTTDNPSRLVFSTTADGASSPTERMRISSNGATSITSSLGQGAEFFGVYKSGTPSFAAQTVDAGGWNGGAATAMIMGRNSSTLRSINAGGTINASGADYAEYMVKAGDFTIAKGDVCGVNAEGQLINEFANAVSFVVKSTNPSYVGGDTWGNEEAIGSKPDTNDAEAFAEWEANAEAVRQTVDRIAFAGQVPVNVTGATPGQYIVPIATEDGGITGIAKDEADLTLAEYMRAVGKVIAIEDDGRARIIVKVA